MRSNFIYSDENVKILQTKKRNELSVIIYNIEDAQLKGKKIYKFLIS